MTNPEPLSLSPEDAAEYVGLSLRSIYRLLDDKVITARKRERRTMIDGDSLRAYYRSLPAYVPGVALPCVTGQRRKKSARRR
jgi:excisionase family DNA binding protein